MQPNGRIAAAKVTGRKKEKTKVMTIHLLCRAPQAGAAGAVGCQMPRRILAGRSGGLVPFALLFLLCWLCCKSERSKHVFAR